MFVFLIYVTVSACTNSSMYIEKLFEERHYEKIINLYNTDPEKYENSPKELAFVAKSYFKLRDYDNALKFYDKAIDLDHYEPMYYSDKGLLYYELGDFHKAVISCDRAIELNSDYPPAYINKSAAYIGMKKWDWAHVELSHVMDMKISEEDKAYAYANLSTIYANTGDYEKALNNASKAIELNKEILWAYKNRAFAYMVKNEGAKAMEDIDSGLELEANDPDLLMYKGIVLIKLHGDIDIGCIYFKDAIEGLKKRGDDRFEGQLSMYEKYCK